MTLLSRVARRALTGLLLLCACETPLTLCTDQVAAVRAAHARCETGVDYRLSRQDGTPVTCDDVVEVVDEDGVICDCIPWAQSVDCAELLTAPDPAPEFCAPERLFRFE